MGDHFTVSQSWWGFFFPPWWLTCIGKEILTDQESTFQMTDMDFLNFFFFFFWLCWVFASVRGLSLVVASGGPLFITVRGPPTVAASLVAEHRLQTRRLSNCGSRAQLLRGTRDPPRPGLEPASPALAGRLPTTAPPGKPLKLLIW